jgi:hypothetical protein
LCSCLCCWQQMEGAVVIFGTELEGVIDIAGRTNQVGAR